jgi:SAM-dependent methyltransferase
LSAQPFDLETFKAGQRQDWDSAAIGWKKWRALFERHSQFVSDRMVELADIRPGHRVLDVSTGPGEPALTAARRVGPGGRILGTDLSPAMLAIARDRAAAAGMTNVQFREMDSEALEFPEAGFDAALCRFGLMFLPDPGAAARRIRKALRPGGRFVAATWSVPPKVPMLSLAMATIQKQLHVPPPPPDVPSPFSLSDPEAMKRLLTRAGFEDARHETFTMVADFASADEYTRFLRDIAAPVRAVLAKQPADAQETVWQAIREAANAYASPDGTVRMPNEGFYFIGQ